MSKVKKSQKAVLKKVMSMLLLMSLITTITGSAVASSSAEQNQNCTLVVTRDGVTYNLNQAQIEVVEDGVVKAYQIYDIKITYDKKGKVKSVTLKMRQVENVISSSTDSSSTVDSIKDIESSQYQVANVKTTADSATINLNQVQATVENSNGTIKQVEIIKVKVKFLKNGKIKIVIKMKQKQIAKSN
jgi:hypothetical protein